MVATNLEAIDQKAGAVVFGNYSGLSKNVKGATETMLAKYNSGEDFPVPEESKQLRRDGFVDLGQVFDAETISAIRENYENRVEDEELSAVRGKHHGEAYSRTVLYPDERIPELEPLLSEKIKQIVQGYYQSYFEPTFLSTIRNYHVPEEIQQQSESFADYWHFDQAMPNRLKLFVYLNDVNEDTGPFHLVEQDDSERLARNDFDRKHDGVPGRVVEQTADVLKFTGPAGSAALCNTNQLLHRAGNPAEGEHRDLVKLLIEPSSVPMDDSWLEQVQPTSLARNDATTQYKDD